MSYTEQILYNDANNFSFDTGYIEIAAAKAQLKLRSAATTAFSEDFADDTGHTYDSLKGEFVGGVFRNKDQRPGSNATFGATFTSGVNGSWGNGSLTGTLVGSATASDGKIYIPGGAGSRAEWQTSGNFAIVQTGTIRFPFTPGSTGAPAAQRCLFFSGGAVSPYVNLIELDHMTSGFLLLRIYDAAGAFIVNAGLGPWLPATIKEYEIEINTDSTTGAHRVFIDGVQIGATQTGTGTRDSVNCGFFCFGNDRIYSSNGANGYFGSLVLFSSVQHTSDYTPSATIPETIYVEASDTLPTYSYTGPGSILSIGDPESTEVGSVRWIVDGQYWTGTAFAASDGTYAQASSKADWIAHLSEFVLSGSNIVVKAVLPAGNTLSSVSDMTFTVTGQAYSTTNPAIIVTSPIITDGLVSFTVTSSATGSDAVLFQWVYDNKYWYHDGADWIESDGSYSQSNTAAEINTNATTFLSDGKSIKLRALLHSEDGSTTPTITSATIIYDLYGEAGTQPSRCVCYLRVNDFVGDAVTSAILRVKSESAFWHGTYLQTPYFKTVTARTDGYCELELVETETIGVNVLFSLTYTDPTTNATKTIDFDEAEIPNEIQQDLSEILTVSS